MTKPFYPVILQLRSSQVMWQRSDVGTATSPSEPLTLTQAQHSWVGGPSCVLTVSFLCTSFVLSKFSVDVRSVWSCMILYDTPFCPPLPNVAIQVLKFFQKNRHEMTEQYWASQLASGSFGHLVPFRRQEALPSGAHCSHSSHHSRQTSQPPQRRWPWRKCDRIWRWNWHMWRTNWALEAQFDQFGCGEPKQDWTRLTKKLRQCWPVHVVSLCTIGWEVGWIFLCECVWLLWMHLLIACCVWFL